MKKHLMLSTILFILLLISCLYSIMTSPVYAAEESVQEKGVAISNDVIGLNLTKYAIQPTEYPQDLYLDALPQENIGYTLETDQSKLDLYYTFVNGKLRKIHVLDNQGSPYMRKSKASDLVEMANDFLSSYKEYSKNAFYEEIGSMLATVDKNENVTTTSVNTKLAVTALENSATFKWIYTVNGIEAPEKCVTLHYENGFLKYFIDNWDLYEIGSTAVNISEEQAIEIAMAEASNFSWSATLDNETLEGLKYKVTNAMVWKTVFANSLFMDNPRGQDRLMLFPMRHIWVSFDKYYPGNVYGMNVYLWADTGEVGHIQDRFITHDPPAELMATVEDIKDNSTPQSDSLSVTWIIFPAFASLIIGTVTTYFARRKASLKSLGLPKLRSNKIGGLLLCLIMSSTILVAAAAPTVNALPQHGRATVWGSESAGSNYPVSQGGHGFSWRKHPDEVTQQQITAAYIKTLYQQNRYSATDNQGSKGSDKSSILDQIETMEQSYPRVSVVDFDHGNGRNDTQQAPGEFHYLFEDQEGTYIGPTHESHYINAENGVYDMEIFPNTALGRYFFVLINTCNSAHVNATYYGTYDSEQGLVGGRARGMPYAWTHRLVKPKTMPGFNTNDHMSDDGYGSPDNGDFVYLGFHFGSAALTQDVDGSLGPKPYWWWLEHFFAYALINNWSVKQALDEASQQFYGSNFGQAPLHSGYTSIWPQYRRDSPTSPPYWHWDTGYNSKMKVYGNANLKLYQPLLTLTATGGLLPTFYVDGQSHGTGTFRKITDVYTFDVTDIPGYIFSHFSYKGTNYGRPANIQIASDGVLTAHYNAAPTQYSLTISAVSGGTTNPSPGTYWYNEGTNVQVTAIEYTNYDFSHWLFNGYTYYQNPITVNMNSNHNLQAIFVPEQQTTHQLTVLCYDNYGQSGYVPLYIDGQYVGTTMNTYTVTEGPHTLSVPYYVGYHYFYGWYYDGEWDYNPTTTVGVYSDKTVTAYYMAYW